MPRSLHDMNSKELGRLFPVTIVDPNPNWPQWYEQERARLCRKMRTMVQIDHIGSTAVPGLRAKPVIDILLQIEHDCTLKTVTDAFQNLGYDILRKPENPPPHLLCVKGYTLHGYRGRPYHVHVRYPGDWDELCFRDYLIAHPKTARDYVRLKDELAKSYRYDRDGYTDAKTDFIQAVVKQARKKGRT